MHENLQFNPFSGNAQALEFRSQKLSYHNLKIEIIRTIKAAMNQNQGHTPQNEVYDSICPYIIIRASPE